MKTTYIPCVQGSLGDWIYYVTVMNVTDLVNYVAFAEQVCPNEQLDEMIQREVSKRSVDIAEYLRTNEQRFFGSLIVAAYDGKPRFFPITFQGSEFMGAEKQNVGILHFDGTEKYYALDGQHRLAALKMEVARDPERYASDQVSVIVICHDKNDVGMDRARRLFTTVNRYAKPTAKTTNIVMDEDDGIALITRRLIREHLLFKKRIKVLVQQGKLATGDAMHVHGDAKYLMAIGTFYKCNLALLPEALAAEFGRKQKVPSYDSLEAGFKEIQRRWDVLIAAVPLWQSLLDETVDLKTARTRDGGHILARPVGITSFVRAVAPAFAQIAPAHLPAAIAHFLELDASPWRGVLWTSATKKMNASRDAEKLAQRIWRHLLSLGEDQAALQATWKAHVDPANEIAGLLLPVPVAPAAVAHAPAAPPAPAD